MKSDSRKIRVMSGLQHVQMPKSDGTSETVEIEITEDHAKVMEAAAKGSFSIRSADTLVEWKYRMYDKVNDVTIVVQSREGVAELLGVPLSEVPEGRLWKCTIDNWQIWQLKP